MKKYIKQTFIEFDKKNIIKKIILAFFALFLLGFGIEFNLLSNLGNDSISVFYQGISLLFNVDVGLAINIINSSLFIIVFIFGKKYINIGTIIYTLTLGTFTSLAIHICEILRLNDFIESKFIFAILGSFFIFVGSGIFISLRIGIDQWNGLVMLLKDKFKIQYKFVKIALDSILLILGFFLGGTIGIVTVFMTILGGPCIQRISHLLDNTLLSWVTINNAHSNIQGIKNIKTNKEEI